MRIILLSALMSLAGCALYSLEDGCGPGRDDAGNCQIPFGTATGGAGSTNAATSGTGAASASSTGAGSGSGGTSSSGTGAASGGSTGGGAGATTGTLPTTGPCNRDDQCRSGLCLGGACCLTASCQRGGTCGSSACSAAGLCLYPDAGSVCQPSSCNGSALQSSSCDGAGRCQTTTESCAGHLGCRAATGACPASCAVDGDCAPSYSCDLQIDGGACVDRLDAGSPCSEDNNCNGPCLGNTCCQAACPRSAENRCPASSCDANGNCGYPVCAGHLTCSATGEACLTQCAQDSDCLPSFVCNQAVGGGTCQMPSDLGPCSGNEDCTSGVCAGNCCSASCYSDGSSECVASSCDSSGACVFPGRVACGSAGLGYCNGGQCYECGLEGETCCPSPEAACSTGLACIGSNYCINPNTCSQSFQPCTVNFNCCSNACVYSCPSNPPCCQ